MYNPNKLIVIPPIIRQVTMMNDVIIHYLLGQEGKEFRLLGLINAIRRQTEQPRITTIEIKNPYTKRLYLENKESILDIKARDGNGNWYNIEFQTTAQKYFTQRIIYYNARIHGTQLSSGNDYGCLCPTISIVFVRERLFPMLDGAFQSFYLLSRTNPTYALSHDLQFHFLQLTEDLNQHLGGVDVSLADWMKFFNIPTTSEEEMKFIFENNAPLWTAWNDVTTFVENDQNKEFLEARERARLDQLTALRSAFEDGEINGEIKGRAEGKIEGKIEGKTEGKTEALILFLRWQTKAEVPKRIQEKLFAIRDEDRLNFLTNSALQVTTLQEFESLLDNEAE